MEQNKQMRLREQIDALDEQITALFVQRMEVAAEIARYKQAQGMPVLDAERERAVLERAARLAGAEYADAARALFASLMALSRAHQSALLSRAQGERP